MVDIALSGISKSFGSVRVFDNLSLRIPDKAYVCLLGPSGCGKSTLMRIVSGLDNADAGQIHFDSTRIDTMTSAQRDVGLAFQHYALYPHLTVEGNLRFPLDAPIQKGRWTENEINERIAETADMLEITPFLHRNINQLSGGQQQRVSLGRALIRRPKVLLLDEPITHLDARLRYAMRTELKLIHQRMGTTTIHVTHDQQEAMAMADLLVIMREGRIEQSAPAMEVYEDPRTSFVAGFLGDPPRTLLDVEVSQSSSALTATMAGVDLSLPDNLRSVAQSLHNDRAILVLPASAFTVAGEKTEDPVLTGIVRAHEMIQDAQRIVLDVGGQRINIQHIDALQVKIGDRMDVHIDPKGAKLFNPESDIGE